MPPRVARKTHPGVSIEDVAAKTGFSTATVSRAVRGLPRVSERTREKILAVAAELGYVASASASMLATGRTRTIGVLAPYVDRWFFYKVLEGAEREVHSQGYNLSLFNLDAKVGGRHRTFSATMVNKQIDALLVLCMALSPEEIEELRQLDIPLVAVGGPVEGCVSVGISDVDAGALATRHLLELGHERIGILHGNDDDEDLNFKVPQLRVEGYHRELLRAGIKPRSEWEFRGNFTLASGSAAFDEFWARAADRPTALVCASDEMAMGVIFQARRRGVRIPEDLSVVGIDNHEFAAGVGLTTVAQDPVEQGTRATRMLIRALSGEPEALQDTRAGFSLIERETTLTLQV